MRCPLRPPDDASSFGTVTRKEATLLDHDYTEADGSRRRPRQTLDVEQSEPFPVGASVVWRSRPAGAVGFVFACRVLADRPDVAAILQPTGAPISTRVGKRGGPRGRSLLSWDGTREERVWNQSPVVRLHPVGRSYSVIRTWHTSEARYRGWYVNLEQPWVRTTVGFDSRDDVLDVTVSDDLNVCTLKDEDELRFAVGEGKLTSGEADAIRATAESAITDVTARRWPFHETAWEALEPMNDSEPLRLPSGWANP